MTSTAFIVSLQYVEFYGDRYAKFKGGKTLLIPSCPTEASAFALALEWLNKHNLQGCYFPRAVFEFATEAAAVADLESNEESFITLEVKPAPSADFETLGNLLAE